MKNNLLSLFLLIENSYFFQVVNRHLQITQFLRADNVCQYSMTCDTADVQRTISGDK